MVEKQVFLDYLLMAVESFRELGPVAMVVLVAAEAAGTELQRHAAAQMAVTVTMHHMPVVPVVVYQPSRGIMKVRMDATQEAVVEGIMVEALQVAVKQVAQVALVVAVPAPVLILRGFRQMALLTPEAAVVEAEEQLTPPVKEAAALFSSATRGHKEGTE